MLRAWAPSPHSQHNHLLKVLKAALSTHSACAFVMNVHPALAKAKSPQLPLWAQSMGP